MANPCFKTRENVWAVASEVVLPAANLTEDDSVVFTVFMTKDKLSGIAIAIIDNFL